MKIIRLFYRHIIYHLGSSIVWLDLGRMTQLIHNNVQTSSYAGQDKDRRVYMDLNFI